MHGFKCPITEITIRKAGHDDSDYGLEKFSIPSGHSGVSSEVFHIKRMK